MSAVIINFSELERPKPKYTEDGVERLKMLIRATLQVNSWSTRELAKKAGVSHVTVSKYVNGHLREPSDETLKALSPYVYRLISITGKGIELDTKNTYEDDWLALSKVATDAFLKSKRVTVNTIPGKIRECMSRQKISQKELEKRLSKMQQDEVIPAEMSVNRLKEIQSGIGNPINDEELRIIRVLIDFDEQIFSEDEWLKTAFGEQSSRIMENPAQSPEQEKRTNGVH